MHWLKLPSPANALAPAFSDLAGARTWLASQPQAQPLHMLHVLLQQIRGLDAASKLDPGALRGMLDLLRKAALPPLNALEARYTRKPLPLSDADQQTFDACYKLWESLSIAYLRLALKTADDEQAGCLQRAANALRHAGFCHYLAACEYPAHFDHLLFGVLAQAQSSNSLNRPLLDPDFSHFGEATIAGHIAWAFLLRMIDPYHLSAPQLAVANRAISRWRELAQFAPMPSDDPKAHSVDLTPLFGANQLPAEVPRWLEIRKVERKLLQRIKALQDGETPESLKLGRELSPAACIRLLRQMDEALEAQYHPESSETGELEIAFGADYAYTLFRNEVLNPNQAMGARSSAIAHQRMAIFGFDRLSQMPSVVKKLEVPSERWSLRKGRAHRPITADSERRLSPCLIATKRGEKARLGVLHGLRADSDGQISAEPVWYEERIEAGSLARKATEPKDGPRTPAFLLRDGSSLSLLLPATAAIRLEVAISLEGLSIGFAKPTEVLERGVDFVRYALG